MIAGSLDQLCRSGLVFASDGAVPKESKNGVVVLFDTKRLFFLFAGPRRRENFFFPAGGEKPLSFFLWCTHTHTQHVGWVNVRVQHVVRRRAARETFAFFLVTAMQFLVGVPSLFAFAGVLVGIGCCLPTTPCTTRRIGVSHAFDGPTRETRVAAMVVSRFCVFFFFVATTHGGHQTHTHTLTGKKKIFSLKGGGVVTETPHPP